MSRILSQDEVRALLQQPESTPSDEKAVKKTDAPDLVSYDFSEREQIPRTRLRYLESLHERFSQSLSLSLSAYLRNTTEVRIAAMQQLSSQRALSGLPDPTVIFLVSGGGKNMIAIIVDNDLALSFVDRILGGTGEEPTLKRALTEIEQTVLQGLLEVIFTDLKQTWGPLIEVPLELDRVETRPSLVTLEPPQEGRVSMKLSVEASSNDVSVEGVMTIVLPLKIADALSTAMARVSGGDQG